MRIIALAFLPWLIVSLNCFADMNTGSASFYTLGSCLKEGTSGIMANGVKLDDDKLTAASWDYPFGTMLRVCNIANNRCVIVETTDRGPNRKLYKKGRIVDLSRAAFAILAPLKQGVITVTVERL